MTFFISTALDGDDVDAGGSCGDVDDGDDVDGGGDGDDADGGGYCRLVGGRSIPSFCTREFTQPVRPSPFNLMMPKW